MCSSDLKEQHMVSSCPDFPVYIDSPLAKKATSIFEGDLRGYMDHDAVWLVRKGTNMFRFPNLHATETSEESTAPQKSLLFPCIFNCLYNLGDREGL